MPFDCESCLNEKSLVESDQSGLPLHVCEYPMIDDCVLMSRDKNICVECLRGFKLNDDQT